MGFADIIGVLIGLAILFWMVGGGRWLRRNISTYQIDPQLAADPEIRSAIEERRNREVLQIIQQERLDPTLKNVKRVLLELRYACSDTDVADTLSAVNKALG